MHLIAISTGTFSSTASLLVCSSSRLVIGGRAWLSIGLPSMEHEKALVVWANTSLGLLLHWWHANKQQAGRGIVGKSALQSLPIFDVSALSAQQMQACVEIFDDLCTKELLPLHRIDKDKHRAQLDFRFVCDVVGLGDADGRCAESRMSNCHHSLAYTFIGVY